MTFLRYLIIFLVVLLVVRIVRQLVSTMRSLPGRRPGPTIGAGDRPPPSGRAADQGSPYEVLQVAPEASPEQIRAAYQRLIRQYHPDRTAQLAPELQRIAEQRTKEINAAYQTLKAWGKVGRANRGG